MTEINIEKTLSMYGYETIKIEDLARLRAALELAMEALAAVEWVYDGEVDHSQCPWCKAWTPGHGLDDGDVGVHTTDCLRQRGLGVLAELEEK